MRCVCRTIPQNRARTHARRPDTHTNGRVHTPVGRLDGCPVTTLRIAGVGVRAWWSRVAATARLRGILAVFVLVTRLRGRSVDREELPNLVDVAPAAAVASRVAAKGVLNAEAQVGVLRRRCAGGDTQAVCQRLDRGECPARPTLALPTTTSNTSQQP